MTTLLEEPTVRDPEAPPRRRREVRWELAGLVALSAVLELWNLDVNGYANDYYAATVKSMSTDWSNFLFASFDPAGVMTVDKPPLALWVQALSARVFGYNPVALLVPQALMTIGSVALSYDLVRRRFGRAGGLAAGLVLALTPLSVAMGRHNNPDALLIVSCVAALWFMTRALEDGRTKWVVWAGVMIGLAFETKMLAAFLVVPGLVLAFLWVAPRGRVAAAKSLALGGAALAVVGGAWPVLMWLTPASSRPWISGTTDNSIWSLIFGYNGLGRLDGQAGGPGGMPGGPGGGGGPFGGSPGPLRLLNESLGGQAGWLLGAAAVAAVALVAVSRLRRDDPRTGFVLAAGGGFAVCAVAFSSAQGIFHPYYVSQLAPFTAVLVGAGAALALRVRWAGPALIAAGAVVELVVIDRDASDLGWAAPLIIFVGVLAAAALATRAEPRTRMVALGAALGALLAAPAAWSVQTLGRATGTTFPAGGPAGSGMGGGMPGRGGFHPPAGMTPPAGFAPPGGPAGDSADLDALIAYTEAHGGGTIGVASQQGASQAIIASGARVAGLGGFSGRESTVSVRWLADAVRDGRVRWVTSASGSGRFGGGPLGNDTRAGSDDAIAAAESVGRKVTVGGQALYDLRGRAGALLAAAS